MSSDHLKAGYPAASTDRASKEGRRYRSKRQRPCDLCRSRKTMCHIPSASQPCQLCQRLDRQCTFLGNPLKRAEQRITTTPRRSPLQRHDVQTTDHDFNMTNLEDFRMEQSQFDHANMAARVHKLPDFQNTNGAQYQADLLDLFAVPGFEDLLQYSPSNDVGTTQNWTWDESSLPTDNAETLHSPDFSAMIRLLGTDTVEQPSDTQSQVLIASRELQSSSETYQSLTEKEDHSSSVFGYTADLDPFLLEHFPYDHADEIHFLKLTYRDVKRADGDHLKGLRSARLEPVHFLNSGRQTVARTQHTINNYLPEHADAGQDREALLKIVDAELGIALITLFAKYIFHALPIFPRSRFFQDPQKYIRTTSVGVLAGMFALAVQFMPWDDNLCVDNADSHPDLEALWKLCWECLQKEFIFPQLSTVQMCLLLLNKPGPDIASPDNAAVWSLVGSTVTNAQTLGLHMDPATWKLPAWEIRLRRRLWWSVIVEHYWRSLTHGRPSLIDTDNWDITPLTLDDFVVDDAVKFDYILYDHEHFMELCNLTLISDEICRTFHSLRAVRHSYSLEDLIEKASEPRQRLQNWYYALPDSLKLQINAPLNEENEDCIYNFASLHIAYFTAQILIFRALTRPILSSTIDLDNLAASVGAILKAAQSLMSTLIQFVRSLDARHFSAFWATYTRTCFCYPGQFGLTLCLQRREEQVSMRCRSLLATWRQLLRTRAQSWPPLRLPALTVDAAFRKGLHKLGQARENGSPC